MARPLNTSARRQQIAQALLTVMATRGYDGATIAAIAEEAKLAPGLIHYHFTNKREILLEAISQLTALFESRFAHLAASTETPHARLCAFVDARLAMGYGADSAAVAAWVVIGAEAVRQPDAKAAYQIAMTAQRDALEQLLADYAGQRLSAEALNRLAAIILATMEGVFQLSISAEEIMPRNYAAQTVMQVIERFVKGQEADDVTRRASDGS
jgi:TetR/AcrR family transcriptional regulator, transcriptional repressor of bet genes